MSKDRKELDNSTVSKLCCFKNKTKQNKKNIIFGGEAGGEIVVRM